MSFKTIFTAHEEQQLIKFVKEHSELYDRSNWNYKKNSKKDDAWKELAQEINKSVDECKSKWKILRDYYHRLEKKGSYFAAGKKGKTLLKNLSFLHVAFDASNNRDHPFISHEESSTLSSATFRKRKQNNDIDLFSESKEGFIDTQTILDGSSMSGCSGPRSRKRVKKQEFAEKLIAGQNHRFSVTGDFIKKDDYSKKGPIINFFISMGEAALKLPPYFQIKAKRLVCNIMCDLEMESLNIGAAPTVSPEMTKECFKL